MRIGLTLPLSHPPTCPPAVFAEVLAKFYDGKADDRTIALSRNATG